MIKSFCCFLFLLFVKHCFAQDSSKILIKADQLASDVLIPERIYQYPKFSRGKIIFKNQTTTEALINYNYLIGEIEFIGPGNDTLAIAKHQLPTIQRIIVNKDTFYYDEGYLQQVLQTQMGKLARRQMLVITKIEKLGAYDRPSSSTKTESMIIFKDYYGSTVNHDLRVRENITMAYRSEYFFGDNYLSFLLANKKNLLKLYPSRKHMINNYLDENKVDFRNIDDLKKMFLFLQGDEMKARHPGKQEDLNYEELASNSPAL